jgi:hypothetical protein
VPPTGPADAVGSQEDKQKISRDLIVLDSEAGVSLSNGDGAWVPARRIRGDMPTSECDCEAVLPVFDDNKPGSPEALPGLRETNADKGVIFVAAPMVAATLILEILSAASPSEAPCLRLAAIAMAST